MHFRVQQEVPNVGVIFLDVSTDAQLTNDSQFALLA